MKKLMIAAAAAAMVGSVFASTCTPGSCAPAETTCDNATVYKFTMTVKTTKGVAQNGGTAGSQCIPGTTGCSVIRTKDSTKFEGLIYDCVCGCDVLTTGSCLAWDSKRKVQLICNGWAWKFLNVMGTKKTEAEGAWDFSATADYDYDINDKDAKLGDGPRLQTYTLMGAGYGSYKASIDKGVYPSFSGNFAGYATASFDLKTAVASNACACDPSQIWTCSCGELSDLDDADTVAFGTWTIKYDSSASKKYYKNGYLKYPSYVQIGE